MTTHTCPAPGCTKRLPQHLLFCRTHWFLCPAPLRDEVLRTWRAQHMAAYLPAREAAIRAVAAQMGPAS